MCYFLLVGGKCLCLIFCLVICELLGGNIEMVMFIVCVLEMIYIMLLIYDDLFVMDNDDYCWGKLINYKVYGEDIVIFVGDGLLSYVFEFVVI